MRRLAAALALLSAVVARTALAQPVLAPTATPTGAVQFHLVSALPQPKVTVQLQLRRGTQANPADWPASLYMQFDSALGASTCTAALVGVGDHKLALLTAAHCVPSNGEVSLDRLPFEPPGAAHVATCKPNPAYVADKSADWALCSFAITAAPPADFKFETIEPAKLENLLFIKADVLLGGYGCTSDLVRAKSNSGPAPLYYIGLNKVIESSTSSNHTYTPDLYTPAQRNNLFTDPWGGANLCGGDSGGPVFRITEVVDGPYDHRVIVAVNSKVFTINGGAIYGGSVLAATGGPDFGTWASNWAAENGLTVCFCPLGSPCSPPTHCRS